jgi:hypothetical protein
MKVETKRINGITCRQCIICGDWFPTDDRKSRCKPCVKVYRRLYSIRREENGGMRLKENNDMEVAPDWEAWENLTPEQLETMREFELLGRIAKS